MFKVMLYMLRYGLIYAHGAFFISKNTKNCGAGLFK
jgi:hypothetical protein